MVLSDGPRNCHQQPSRPRPVSLQLCPTPAWEQASFSFRTPFSHGVRAAARSWTGLWKCRSPCWRRTWQPLESALGSAALVGEFLLPPPSAGLSPHGRSPWMESTPLWLLSSTPLLILECLALLQEKSPRYCLWVFVSTLKKETKSLTRQGSCHQHPHRLTHPVLQSPQWEPHTGRGRFCRQDIQRFLLMGPWALRTVTTWRLLMFSFKLLYSSLDTFTSKPLQSSHQIFCKMRFPNWKPYSRCDRLGIGHVPNLLPIIFILCPIYKSILVFFVFLFPPSVPLDNMHFRVNLDALNI